MNSQSEGDKSRERIPFFIENVAWIQELKLLISGLIFYPDCIKRLQKMHTILNILFQKYTVFSTCFNVFQNQSLSFLTQVLQAVLNSYSKCLSFIFMLIQKQRNLCIFPKISLKILELFHFGLCVCFLNWETLLCQEWAKMERRRKEWKRDGWKGRREVASLCCLIFILLCKNITSALHYWNVLLPATQDLPPRSGLNYHLKIWITYYLKFLSGFLLHLVLLLLSRSLVSDSLCHHGLQHAGLPILHDL